LINWFKNSKRYAEQKVRNEYEKSIKEKEVKYDSGRERVSKEEHVDTKDEVWNDAEVIEYGLNHKEEVKKAVAQEISKMPPAFFLVGKETQDNIIKTRVLKRIRKMLDSKKEVC